MLGHKVAVEEMTQPSKETKTMAPFLAAIGILVVMIIPKGL